MMGAWPAGSSHAESDPAARQRRRRPRCKPVFTRKKAEAAPPATDDLLQQQIAELQAAAAQNADHIKELAAQLQSTVAALKRAVVMCVVAMAISVVSLFDRARLPCR